MRKGFSECNGPLVLNIILGMYVHLTSNKRKVDHRIMSKETKSGEADIE